MNLEIGSIGRIKITYYISNRSFSHSLPITIHSADGQSGTRGYKVISFPHYHTDLELGRDQNSGGTYLQVSRLLVNHESPTGLAAEVNFLDKASGESWTEAIHIKKYKPT